MLNQAFEGESGAWDQPNGARMAGVFGTSIVRRLWKTASCLTCASLFYGQSGGARNVAGALRDNSAKPLTGTVTASLSLYAERGGGSPLCVETQTSA